MNGLWLTIDINGLSMVLGKVNAGSQKRPNRKKTWFFQQKHRGKQTLDRLTWPNVTKVSLGNHFSSILALWLPPLQHLKVLILTIAIEWMVGKPPLISMVLRWFLVSKTIGSNGFPMVFGPKTIVSNCFSNGFWSKNHWYQWFFNGFVVRQPLDTMVFQWFPMVVNHWSDDGMVTIHRSGLTPPHFCVNKPICETY